MRKLLEPYPVVRDVGPRRGSAFREAMAAALQTPKLRWNPGRTVVGVLPFSGETTPENRSGDSREVLDGATEAVMKEFRDRGFRVVRLDQPAGQVRANEAILPKFAIPSAEALSSLGCQAGANVVVAGSLLLQVKSGNKKDKAGVELRLVDAAATDCVFIAAGSAVCWHAYEAGAEAASRALAPLLDTLHLPKEGR